MTYLVCFGYESSEYPKIYFVAEGFFVIDLLFKFLTSYKNPETFIIERDIRVISMTYIK